MTSLITCDTVVPVLGGQNPKSFRIRSYRKRDPKSFGIRSYKKCRGVGGGATSFQTMQDDAVGTGARYEIENTGGRIRRTGTGSSATARKPFFPSRPVSATAEPNDSHIADSAFLL